MPCNSGQTREQESAKKCGICNPLQPSATPDRTLVAGAGQRFESARRLSRFGLDKPNTRNKSMAGQRAGVSLHHPYITEARGKMMHNLLARNGCRSAQETVVL